MCFTRSLAFVVGSVGLVFFNLLLSVLFILKKLSFCLGGECNAKIRLNNLMDTVKMPP